MRVAIFTPTPPLTPSSPCTHSFEWEKPELQYTADILDYQVHLALEPLEPTAKPDQIIFQVNIPNSVNYFTLPNVLSRVVSYLVPLLKIFVALIPAKQT